MNTRTVKFYNGTKGFGFIEPVDGGRDVFVYVSALERAGLNNRFGLSGKVADVYRVTATLPARDNSPQYRIRSDEEPHDRVTSEDSLEEVAPSAPVGRASV